MSHLSTVASGEDERAKHDRSTIEGLCRFGDDGFPIYTERKNKTENLEEKVSVPLAEFLARAIGQQ